MSTTESLFTHTYESLKEYNFEKFEFGYPMWRYTLHKLPDGLFVASHEGNRFYEWHPDGSQYLLYDYDRHTAGVTNRYGCLVRNTIFGTTLVRRANGEKRVSISYTQSQWDSAKHRHMAVKHKTVVGNRRFRVVPDSNGHVELVPIAESTTKYIKDNDKYRAFNKRLKLLRAVLTTQAKMGAYDDLEKMPRYSYSNSGPSLQDEMTKITGEMHSSHVTTCTKMSELAHAWLDTRDNSKLRRFVVCAMMNHTSSERGREDVMRRINNALKYVQKTYLRDHCVKIEESKNSLNLSNDFDDQNRELLPPAGLREVQVLSEAEVC